MRIYAITMIVLQVVLTPVAYAYMLLIAKPPLLIDDETGFLYGLNIKETGGPYSWSLSESGDFFSVRGHEALMNDEASGMLQALSEPPQLHQSGSKERALATGKRQTSYQEATEFLWIDYRDGYAYFEVFECCRRLLLTAALVFVEPGSATQQYVACLFAMTSLGIYAAAHPHKRQTKTVQYVLGGLVIFITFYLALAKRVDISGDELGSKQVFATAANALSIVLAISGLALLLGGCLLGTQSAKVGAMTNQPGYTEEV
ncbi:unnamed protein product [Chrysoparadoxa australica]